MNKKDWLKKHKSFLVVFTKIDNLNMGMGAISYTLATVKEDGVNVFTGIHAPF